MYCGAFVISTHYCFLYHYLTFFGFLLMNDDHCNAFVISTQRPGEHSARQVCNQQITQWKYLQCLCICVFVEMLEICVFMCICIFVFEFPDSIKSLGVSLITFCLCFQLCQNLKWLWRKWILNFVIVNHLHFTILTHNDIRIKWMLNFLIANHLHFTIFTLTFRPQ